MMFGDHYTITELKGFPKPIQRPYLPLFMAGSGKRSLTLAAREADIIGLMFGLRESQYHLSGSIKRWRLDFAHALSTHLKQFAGIEAIAVLGSVARGYSDAYSDLELLLVWNQLPNPDQQSALLRALHAEFRYPAFDPGYQSAFRIQGIPVDLWHTTIAHEEAVIHSVMHALSLDQEPQPYTHALSL